MAALMRRHTDNSRTLASVDFHSDGLGRDVHPAINVKHYRGYQRCPDDIPERVWDRLGESAWQSCVDRFWESAEEIARERGYTGVFSEGRSGGWLVPYYQSRSSAHYQGMNFRDGNRWAGPIRYPDIERDRCDIGELSRFTAFRRRIQALLDDVPYQLEQEIAFYADAYREERRRQEARRNYVDHESDADEWGDFLEA